MNCVRGCRWLPASDDHRHLAYGLSNREIARSLDISIETVKEHVQKVFRKLDMSGRTAAAIWIVKRGLV